MEFDRIFGETIIFLSIISGKHSDDRILWPFEGGEKTKVECEIIETNVKEI